jgi:hypothetical protein
MYHAVHSVNVPDTIKHLPHLRHRQHAKRRHFASSADFDTSNSIEVRKYLRTYGLTPPGVDTFEKQEQRCEQTRRSTVQPLSSTKLTK